VGTIAEQPILELFLHACRFFLAFIFLGAGISKLTQTEEFAQAISNYGLVPERFSHPIAVWLPRAEVLAGLMLLLGVAIMPGALGVAVLLLGFSVAVGINLLRGREMSCNCFGGAAPERMTWTTVGRNITLMAMAVSIFALPPSALAVWPGTATSTLSPGAVLAMLVASTSAVLLLGLVNQGWRLMSSVRGLESRLSGSKGESA
jgi:uncharacterized membrane protein YphA (DoxX/SURF4 family)